MVDVNGVLCTIQLRKGCTKTPKGREYARFDVNDQVKRAKVALWAMEKRTGTEGVCHSTNPFAKSLVGIYSR
jgi:hypothetical protein